MKHKFILPKIISNMENDYDKLHRWGLSDSFLMSPQERFSFLKLTEVILF